MYILMISRGFPTKEFPQWGCFEQDQAEALQRNGHKVIVISVDSRFLKRWRRVGITHITQNYVDYYNSFWIPGSITSLFGNKCNQYIKERQLNRILRLVIQEHGLPDVIYSHYLFNSFISLSLKRKYNIPLVVIEHWSEVNKDVLNPYVRFMGNSVYHTADKIIAVSDSLRLMLKRNFQVDSEVVHNIVGDGFGYKPFIKTNNIFNFVSVGSLLPVKGYDILIESFSLLANTDNVRLTIIGGGNQYDFLMKLIQKYNLRDKVFLLGKKNKKEIADILAHSDAYISSSRSENFSVSVLEALSVGLPVIATLCGGIRECINNNNGILVPIENPKELSNAMLKMIENIHNYQREYIAKDFENRFSTNTIISKLNTIFESVVNI